MYNETNVTTRLFEIIYPNSSSLEMVFYARPYSYS